MSFGGRDNGGAGGFGGGGRASKLGETVKRVYDTGKGGHRFAFEFGGKLFKGFITQARSSKGNNRKGEPHTHWVNISAYPLQARAAGMFGGR